MTSLNVAVFAHNEEKNIRTCLESIRLGTSRPQDLPFMVLTINGIPDRELVETVAAYAREHPQFTPRRGFVTGGDKANAWNTCC